MLFKAKKLVSPVASFIPHHASSNHCGGLQISSSIDSCQKSCQTEHFFQYNSLSVFISNQEFKALIDTGADKSVIDYSTLKKLPLPVQRKLVSQSGRCKVANNAEIEVIGNISLSMTINGQKFRESFMVLSGTSCDLFLGVSFLRKHKATLDFSLDIMTLTSQPLSVLSITRFTIDPYSEILCRGQIAHNVPNQTSGLCQNTDQAGRMLVANSVVTVYDNHVPVRLYNCSNQPLTVKKGRILANFIASGGESNSNNSQPTHDPTHSAKACSIQTTTASPTIDLNCSNINESQKTALSDLIKSHSDCFVDPENKQLGLTDLIDCKIETMPDAKPVHKLPYRVNPHLRTEMDKIIQDQMKLGLIEESHDSIWASPALLIKKPGGRGYRLVCDYRGLNAVTIPQFLRIPRIDDVLDAVGENQPQYFSVLDCTQGFHQIPIHPDSKEKTGFITPSGKYQYRTMPQGIRNAPMVFQSLMDKILRGVQYKYVMAYIDDICVFSPTFEKHLEHLADVFQRLRNANLKLHPQKCKFAVSRVNFLGHVLSRDGVSPDPEKVDAVKTFPTPKTLKQLRGFLGLSGYFRKFIKNYSVIARPLYALTTKNTPYVWSSDCQKAFEKLKMSLTSDSVLVFPDFRKLFTLSTDASTIGIGACLSQEINGQQKPIAFAGRSLSKAESNYSTTEQELLAVVWAIKHFRVYLQSHLVNPDRANPESWISVHHSQNTDFLQC